MLSFMTINCQMNVETLIARGCGPKSAPLLKKWYGMLSPEAREIVDTLIGTAYMYGKQDAAAELNDLVEKMKDESTR